MSEYGYQNLCKQPFIIGLQRITICKLHTTNEKLLDLEINIFYPLCGN